MLAIEIIANKMEYPEEAEKHKTLTPEICAVTGKETYYPVFCKKRLFSDVIGFGSRYLDYKIMAILGQNYLRKCSWIIDNRGHIETIKGKQIRELLYNLPEPQWGLYIAPDMRKMGAMATIANKDNTNPVMQYGYKRVYAKTIQQIYEQIEKLYNAGFSKKELQEPDQAFNNNIIKYGVKNWLEFKKWAACYVDSPEWEVAVKILPTQEEMKEVEECQDCIK